MSDSEADEPLEKPGGKRVDPSGFGSASGRAAARKEKSPKEPRPRRLRREKSPKPPPPEPGPPMLEMRSRKRPPEPEPDSLVETPADSLVEPVETPPEPVPTPDSLVEPVETIAVEDLVSTSSTSEAEEEPDSLVEPVETIAVEDLVSTSSTSEAEEAPDSLVEPVETIAVEDLVSTSSTSEAEEAPDSLVEPVETTGPVEEVSTSSTSDGPTPLMTDIPATSAATRRRSFASAGAAVLAGGVVLAVGLANGGWGTVSYVGAFVLAFGLILAVLSVPLLRQHRFLLSEVGVRWEQSGHDTWESPWHQLQAVTLYLDADGPDQPPVQIGFRDLRSNVENTFAIESSALPAMRAALAAYAPDLTVLTVHPHGH